MSSQTEEIALHSALLANAIRSYCRSQRDIWRQLPQLALLCDGRTGWSSQLSFCWRSGYWGFNPAGPFGHLPAVDCANGELVIPSKGVLADDGFVLTLAASLDGIDAEAVADGLRQSVSRPQAEYVGPPPGFSPVGGKYRSVVEGVTTWRERVLSGSNGLDRLFSNWNRQVAA